MAIYIYTCQSCEKAYELEKSMSDNFKPEQLICIDCGNDLKRDYNAEAHPVHVPESMRAEWSMNPRSKFSYDKRPSARTDSVYVNGFKK